MTPGRKAEPRSGERLPAAPRRATAGSPGARDLLAPIPVEPDDRRGLDHGTWSVLRHVFPEAGVPLVQLCPDETRPAKFHREPTERRAPLRDEGDLVRGSGNLVHNLCSNAWGRYANEPLEWAARFETLARELQMQS